MKRELRPCVYIMTNKNNKVLYTGATSNLFKRVSEHKAKVIAGFTAGYNVTKLVSYEEFNTMEQAIAREKQIKGGSRKKKLDLINSVNSEWKDLFEVYFGNSVIASDSEAIPQLPEIASPKGGSQ